MTEEFDNAVNASKSLPQRPANDELLKLYALFKQATEGDNTGERPGGFDFKGIAKHDAWAELKGKDSADAETEYIQFVKELQAKYA
ncbi:acyl-CoA-binding protein [Fulvivirga ligni]|uniref:acyl-CoA-binding protein n=1 Tax=Fulvivirga ligni TaxID=2904246 RepID=UPI001F458070|nr:acyl-CoA-binding protein [Fulvivirga ligni]UII23960.1 acyl-CoA-binding protein [Fulvivirga ligni]